MADKRSIVTIVDIYNLFEDEQKVFRVIQRAVQNLPSKQRALLGELQSLQKLGKVSTRRSVRDSLLQTYTRKGTRKPDPTFEFMN